MVTVEMVEKACRARISAQWGRPVEDHEWAAVRSGIEEKWMGAALAAVLPEAQAQAWIAGRDDGLDDLGSTQTAIDFGELTNPYETEEST